MRSAGFGRRVIEPGGRELVLIPGGEAPSPAPELANRDELKEQIRTALMARIDPSVAGRIPRNTLRAEVALLHAARTDDDVGGAPMMLIEAITLFRRLGSPPLAQPAFRRRRQPATNLFPIVPR
jgi:hypothetical protein